MRGRAPGPLLMLAVALLTCFPSGAFGTDVRLSGFGTIAYARSSERDVAYLRYIDRDGTFKADSLAGVQAEAQFSPQWGATVQAVASAPRARDDGHEAKVRWAFVSFRPDNDWLFRLGRVRPPFFFNIQNAEVGTTYDPARLPVEVYATSPIYDFDGLSVNRSWLLPQSEYSLEAYWGRSKTQLRGFNRDLDEPIFERFKVRAGGAVVSRTAGPLSLRFGIHQAQARFPQERQPFQSIVATTPFDPAPPPLGGTLYQPVNPRSTVRLNFFTFGADWRSGDWRVTAEYVRRSQLDQDFGLQSDGAYVTVARTIGRWTPYATYGRLLSSSETRDMYAALNTTPVPLLAQGPPLFLPPNFHRFVADNTLLVYDQHSWTAGAAYSFSPTSKVKLEWNRTRVGITSSFVDGNLHNQSFNVFTLAYSIAF